MLTKTICTLTAALALTASTALALEEGALSAMPPSVSNTPATNALQAYASARQYSRVRSGPRIVRPFTNDERNWFEIPQGRD
jgi:hypothetical protein